MPRFYRVRRFCALFAPLHLCLATLLPARASWAREPSQPNYGVYFAEGLRPGFRALIVEDFAWLASLGELKNSDAFVRGSRIKGIVGQGQRAQAATGAEVLAWILNNIRVIYSLSACPISGGVVLSYDGARYDFIPSYAGNDRWWCPDENSGEVAGMAYGVLTQFLLPWRSAMPNERDGVIVDGQAIMMNQWPVPPAIIALNQSTPGLGSQTLQARFYRLGLIAHEAQHLAGSYHVKGIDFWAKKRGAAAAFADRKGFAEDGSDLDDDYSGAYFVSGALLASLADSCQECSESEKEIGRRGAGAPFSHVSLKLKSGPRVLFPAGYFKGLNQNLEGRKLDGVPPLYVLQYYRSLYPDDSSFIEGIDAIIARLRRADDESGGQLARPPWSEVVTGHLNEFDSQPAVGADQAAAAAAWVAAARKSVDMGYNTPTPWRVSCGNACQDQSPGGYSAGAR